jgi:hypothetical protein
MTLTCQRCGQEFECPLETPCGDCCGTCPACIEARRHRDAYAARLAFREEEAGGAFDGINVISDADSGL